MFNIENKNNQAESFEDNLNDSVPDKKILKQEPQTENNPTMIMGLLKNIRDKFRRAFVFAPASNNELKNRMDEELTAVEYAATKEGVDFSRCQMEKVVEAYQKGRKVEFESFSPYLSDYDLSTGKIWDDKLTATDNAGIVIGKVLRAEFPKARLISLYDEYNTELPDTSNPRGIPEPGAQITLPDETKRTFYENIKQLLKNNGLISPDAKEGGEYLLISESLKVKDAEILINKLELNGNIERDGESIYFINPESENPAYRRIQLRTKAGRWLCEALDASSYIKPENLEITHLVVLPNHFKEQQDKVWEILRVLGIMPTNYHNIFFDENNDPEIMAKVIQAEINSFRIKQGR